MKAIQVIIACLGRICMGILFVLSGLEHLLNWAETQQMILTGVCQWVDYPGTTPLIQAIVGIILPWIPVLSGIVVVLLIFGGLLVFFGIKTRFGAFLLLLFLVPTTFIVHAFWILPPEMKAEQMIHFMKNIAIIGGLLFLLSFGNGSSSVKKVATEE